MATKSILKNINIRDEKSVFSLINALENASGKHAQPVIRSHGFTDASMDDIQEMFREYKLHRLLKRDF